MDKGKINVMFVTHSDKKGGAEQSLIHLMNHLDASKYRIYLLSPANTSYLHEIKAEYEHFPLRLNSIKKKVGFGYLETVLRIKAFAKNKQIDIIHANGWRAPWYAAPLKYLTDCKLVWHHRDYSQSGMFNRVLPRFFDQVICISQFVANSIRGDNKTVIYNGVDPDSVAPGKNRAFMQDGTLVIGMFGRIVEWKRYHLAIEAAKRLTDSGRRSWKLLIVGDTSVDGSEQYLQEMNGKVAEYGLEHQVVFHGYSDKPLELMKECDLTINFSLNEPFGRVIIESMLAHTPVVVADSGGAPEIVRRAHGGFIVKDGDAEELCSTIARFYDKSVDYEELSNQGYTGVLNNFNMNAIARHVEDAYDLMRAYQAEPVMGVKQ
ncbi:glycosyltransferase [Cohnella terricola]|uniref:Glycosyltransferase n=1 Tax=Cohnella terricola TaxID=1289167 RepID=A0A559JN06_9BACL|nr:glycosyltransferase [Cohnella terricola]TVY01253.1 glycosyltransferase [Cohnella terricola]